MRRSDVLEQLGRRLSGRLTPGLADLLDRQGFIQEVLLGALAMEDLEREAREVLAIAEELAVTRREPATSRGRQNGPRRSWALSHLVAAHARADQRVVVFRQRWLGGEVLPWAELAAWINDQAEHERRTVDATVTVDREEVRFDEGTLTLISRSRTVPVAHVSSRTLDFVGPGDEWVQHMSVSAGGVLDATRALATRLADDFGWWPAHATAFLLADVTPSVANIRVTSPALKTRDGVELTWAMRIKLDIDPMADPEEVLAAYRKARAELGLPRKTSVSGKHLRLAVFACVEHQGIPWAERLRMWNHAFPDWEYLQESNFRRDALRARTRTLFPERKFGG